MNKNKRKKITFAEITGVLIIIGIILLIIIPIIFKASKVKKEKLYVEKLSNLLLSVEKWAEKNSESLPKNENEIIKITLGQLRSENIIDEVENPKTNKYFDDSLEFMIRKTNDNYIYSIEETTVKTKSKEDNFPIIKLAGKTLEYYNIGDTYKESGYKAYDSEGNEIVEITNNLKENEFNEKGIYNIKYEAKDKLGNKTYAIRTIIVK